MERKRSSFPENPSDQEANLMVPPNAVQFNIVRETDGHWMKEWIMGEIIGAH